MISSANTKGNHLDLDFQRIEKKHFQLVKISQLIKQSWKKQI